MHFHFTKHAQEKIKLLAKYGFKLTRLQIQQIILHPAKTEKRDDGIYIASSLFDETHVIRVVYRTNRDIIIVITLYPGRRKSYEL